MLNIRTLNTNSLFNYVADLLVNNKFMHFYDKIILLKNFQVSSSNKNKLVKSNIK